MARQRQRRRRPHLGLLTPDQLLVHRELELLRVAGRPRPRSRGARKRHVFQMRRRAAKLEAAKQLVAPLELPAAPKRAGAAQRAPLVRRRAASDGRAS
jgi:hypothetical protein